MFGPLAQILLHEMGEAAHAPPEALRARLEEFVLECTSPDEARQIVERLCIALGIGGEARDEKRYRVAEIRSGLLALLRGFASRGPIVVVLEDIQAAQTPMLELVEELVREADGIPLLVVCAARYSLLDDHPGWGGGRGNSVNLYMETLSLDDSTQLARDAGEGLDEAYAAADRAARRREPVLHHRDDRDAAARGQGALGRHRAAAAGAAAADRPGRDRGPDRPPLAAGPGPDPQGLGVRPVLVHARRARPRRRAERRGARPARGGGAARARRRPARTLALQPRHGARRRVREPPQARAPAPAPAGGRRALGQPGDRGPAPARDRVPPRAGGPRGARPQPARPDARRTRGRRARPRRRHRARGSEHEGGRGGLPARARARRPRTRVGPPRGVDPREPRRDPVLARRVRTCGPGARTRARSSATATSRSGRRPRGSSATSSCSILGDAKRAAELLDDALDAARGPRRSVDARADAARRRVGAVLPAGRRHGARDVPGGARHGAREPRGRPLVRGPVARRASRRSRATRATRSRRSASRPRRSRSPRRAGTASRSRWRTRRSAARCAT